MAEKKPSIEEIIKKSVNAAVRATQQAPKDAYKATEKRLYALPYLKQKCEDDRELYQELLTYGTRQKSSSGSRKTASPSPRTKSSPQSSRTWKPPLPPMKKKSTP